MHNLNFVLSLLMLFATASNCQAGFIFNIRQVNSDVVATGSGSFNLAGLTFVTNGNASPRYVNASTATLQIGGVSNTTLLSAYTDLTSKPSNFGSGGGFFASSSTGDYFGFTPFSTNFYWLYVPQGYVSGTALSGSSTWTNENLSQMGLSEGVYSWAWGSGANADSATLTISSSSNVPEPNTISLLVLGIAAYFGIRQKRVRSS